jgi:predicted AAA+ superfamily ATPase
MIIIRDTYLNKLIRREKNGLIKVVTGVRRCGKSYLLSQLFHDYLIGKGIAESHIIEIALDDRKNAALRNPDAILSYIDARITDEGDYYIVLDEVQLLSEFVDVLNSLLHIRNVDVYVTGSNSKFLSSDVVTEFRGRGDEVRVHPLSFREYISAYSGSDSEAWDDYITYGGLPLILTRDTPEDKAEYLKNLFKEVYISDMVERKKIRNRSELDELVDMLASATGSLTNPLKLARTFKSVKNKSISSNTLRNYLDYLEDSFLINKAARYDVKGKKYIGSPVKYYFEDVGLRNARLNFRQTEENHLMENIVYNELRIRGFNVDVGVVEIFGKENGKTTKKQLEIDFVASVGSRKYYIQSAFSMSDSTKSDSEQRPLTSVRDSFKKIIVVRDDIKPRRNEDGIMTIGIRNFLLNENSLDE